MLAVEIFLVFSKKSQKTTTHSKIVVCPDPHEHSGPHRRKLFSTIWSAFGFKLCTYDYYYYGFYSYYKLCCQTIYLQYLMFCQYNESQKTDFFFLFSKPKCSSVFILLFFHSWFQVFLFEQLMSLFDVWVSFISLSLSLFEQQLLFYLVKT